MRSPRPCGQHCNRHCLAPHFPQVHTSAPTQRQRPRTVYGLDHRRQAGAALSTLTALEIVRGIHNMVFLSIPTSRLPIRRQPQARNCFGSARRRGRGKQCDPDESPAVSPVCDGARGGPLEPVGETGATSKTRVARTSAATKPVAAAQPIACSKQLRGLAETDKPVTPPAPAFSSPLGRSPVRAGRRSNFVLGRRSQRSRATAVIPACRSD